MEKKSREKNEKENKKNREKTYRFLPTECLGHQFAQRARYSTPTSLSQPAERETLINDTESKHQIKPRVSSTLITLQKDRSDETTSANR